ncbi:hypothetical protein [Halalkalibacter lacteus]|uniref:hypothetical protein n=1 Tax=Halalkalibacter lacteus TaxID=3090663 RepID=UPI002FC5D35B
MFKRILFVSGILILGMVIGNFFFSDTLADNQDDNSKHKDEIAYPQNEKGQTFGSALDAPSYEDEPYLIKAYGIDGTIGYVKKKIWMVQSLKHLKKQLDFQMKLNQEKFRCMMLTERLLLVSL